MNPSASGEDQAAKLGHFWRGMVLQAIGEAMTAQQPFYQAVNHAARLAKENHVEVTAEQWIWLIQYYGIESREFFEVALAGADLRPYVHFNRLLPALREAWV